MIELNVLKNVKADLLSHYFLLFDSGLMSQFGYICLVDIDSKLSAAIFMPKSPCGRNRGCGCGGGGACGQSLGGSRYG